MASRIRRGKLETATEVYVKDGRTAALLGVTHIASHEYWRRVQTRIDAAVATGAEIHYESVKDDRISREKIMPDMRKVADFLGLQYQMSAIHYSPEWKRTDLTFSEVFSGASDAEKLHRQASEFEEFMVGARDGKHYDKYARVTCWLLRMAPLLSRVPLGFAGARYNTIMGRRNMCAVDAINAIDADVLAIWGAAHVRGIGKTLRGQGWSLKAREWDVAL